MDFRLLRHPKNSVGIRSASPRKRSNENNALRLPTKSPKVNRSGEYRPGENGFRLYRHGRSGEPRRYNPRKQREISPTRTSGEWVCGRLGGGTGTAVEQSLGRKILILLDSCVGTPIWARSGRCSQGAGWRWPATPQFPHASGGLSTCERVRNRFSRPLSSENMPPRPGTTSMTSRVCAQAAPCARLM